MSKKAKFITTIICMFIIILVIFLGIWSALNINNLIWGNSIKFDSEAIEYSLICKLEGNDEKIDKLGNKKYFSREVTGYNHENVSGGFPKLSTWNLGKMTFIDSGEENAVVYTICVRNNSLDRNIYIAGFTGPNEIHRNINLSYRMGFGQLTGRYSWGNNLATLTECDTFTVYDETVNSRLIDLNNSSNGLFVSPKEIHEIEDKEIILYSYFMLEIKVVLINKDVSVKHQDLNFSIGFYNEQQ